MRKHLPSRGRPTELPWTFFSVGETAQMLRTSDMTLYRAIQDGEFPAIRVRGRLVVPALAIEQMVKAAVTSGALVNAADWVRTGPWSETSSLGASSTANAS